MGIAKSSALIGSQDRWTPRESSSVQHHAISRALIGSPERGLRTLQRRALIGSWVPLDPAIKKFQRAHPREGYRLHCYGQKREGESARAQ